MYKLSLLALLLVAVAFSSVHGHGRMIRPPNRSSIWRFPEYASQNPPPNYTDNELYCGGVHQADNPGTNCGPCGDPVGQARPRANEHGGTYGRGIVTGRYSSGQVIDVEVDMTQGHLGFMEFRLCTNRNNDGDQNCFNQNLLQLEGGGTRVNVQSTGVYRARLRLPNGVRCDQCVLQWNYRAGNNWPADGPQETFRGCSDIVIN